MSTFVNNGQFRRTKLNITQKVNGIIESQTERSILNAIPSASLPALTTQEFAILSDGQYTNRLNAFYSAIEAEFDYFERVLVGNATIGTDAVSCPIDSPDPVVIPPVDYAPDITVSFTNEDNDLGGYGSGGASLIYDKLIYTFMLTQNYPEPFSLQYQFRVPLIMDGVEIRFIALGGTIVAGANSDTNIGASGNGQSITIPEVTQYPDAVLEFGWPVKILIFQI